MKLLKESEYLYKNENTEGIEQITNKIDQPMSDIQSTSQNLDRNRVDDWFISSKDPIRKQERDKCQLPRREDRKCVNFMPSYINNPV